MRRASGPDPKLPPYPRGVGQARRMAPHPTWEIHGSRVLEYGIHTFMGHEWNTLEFHRIPQP